jgi:hypothetical protein
MAKKTQQKPKTVKDLVVTSRQIINGWTSPSSSDARLWGVFPLQMISKFEKNNNWIKWNMDWFERLGYDTLTTQYSKISKDYNMAEGILDPTDYGKSSTEDNYVVEMINENEEGNMPIMFFPIVPTIINLFVGEYIKRDSRIIIKAIDEYTQNKRQQEKKDIITKILIDKVKADISAKYNDNPEDPNVQKEIDYQQQLIETEQKFKKYSSIAEQWANHMVKWDNMRFQMKELQSQSFRDVLVADKTFWHIRVLEDDIKPEIWNPRNVFYHKPIDKLWMSDSTYIGRQMYMSLAEIIQNYNHLMEENDYNNIQGSQLSGSLGTNNSLVNLVQGTNIGDNSKWTDFSQEYPYNITDSTLENTLLQDRVKKQVNLWVENKGDLNLDDSLRNNMLRVTEVYWRSYAKEGTLTSIDELGIKSTDTVNEDFIVTQEPKYDNSLNKKNTKANLISGEHVDWYWKPEIRFGVKIARRPIAYSTVDINSLENGIYLSGKPIDVQLGKIPVEGMSLTDRNVDSVSLVRKMSPFQIGYNIVNNQNIDMLGNALATGKVIMIDQNFIPKKSFGETWGKDAMGKWLEIIRNNNIALMDGSPVNNPSGTGFSHFQVLDFSNTEDILRNIQLGNYFKEQAFSVIGVNNQRVGTVAASETATGVQTAQSNSYAQTEYMYEKHLNQLMPRVREMMLNLEQYLASTKPKVRIAYTNTDDESVLFELEGKELLLPILQVHAYSTSDVKSLVEKMQQMAMQINTAGAEMSDYMEIMNSDSPSLIVENLKKGEEKRRQDQEAQRKHEQEMQQAQQQAREAELQRQEDLQKYLQDKELETKRYIAELGELGGIQTDANANSELDALENLKEFHKQDQFNKTLNFQKEQHLSEQQIKEREMNFKEKELLSRNNIENKKVEVAKINKNVYDKK